MQAHCSWLETDVKAPPSYDLKSSRSEERHVKKQWKRRGVLIVGFRVSPNLRVEELHHGK